MKDFQDKIYYLMETDGKKEGKRGHTNAKI